MQKINRQSTFDRNRYYTLLRVGKEQLDWDDEFYYGIWLPMQGATLKDGKYSASTLSNTQLFTALETMKGQGFKIKPSAKPQRKQADDAQSKKIRALWLELYQAGVVRNPDESALAAYVKRQTGVAALQWLSTAQGSTVIEALKQWLQRTAKE